MKITVPEHPLLDPICFLCEYPKELKEIPTPSDILAYFGEKEAPLATSNDIRHKIRDLLRYAGFKPTGRSKPASEFLLKAIEKGWFGPEKGINLAVDICNVVSLHSGIPISVIDAEKAELPWSLQICEEKTSYVFNPSGQEIDIGKLISFFDNQGPCGGPVKDSQRTKTSDETTSTVSVLWGTKELPGHTQAAFEWYQSLLEQCQCKVTRIEREETS